MSKTIRALADEMAEVNEANGWWDRWKAVQGDEEAMVDHMVAKLGLITTEVSEAIEEVRSFGTAASAVENNPTTPRGKPVGLTSELADIIIRTIDFASLVGITDLAEVIEKKAAYNATRGVLHGGKRV